jgi:hypothetical protein
MTTRLRLDLVFGGLMLTFAALVLLQIPFGDSSFYTKVYTGKTVVVVGSVLRILALGVAWWFVRRGAAQFESGNPARPAWSLLKWGLGGYFAAQVVLSGMNIFMTNGAPFPSVADAVFVISTLLLFLGVAAFVHAYSIVGYIGSGRNQTIIVGAIAAVVLFFVNWKALSPIIQADLPGLETAVNCAYPIFDSLLAIASIALLRVTVSFLGGGLWRVWLALLAGFLFMTAGDILYAYEFSLNMPFLNPITDWVFTWGYLLLARGAIDHYLLIGGEGN